MMCDFKPGDEVICVDAKASDGCLAEGRHYIVLTVHNGELGIHHRTGRAGIVWFLRVGAPTEVDGGGWYQSRFRRPIVDEDVIEADQGALVLA